jgi:hypothetical protein
MYTLVPIVDPYVVLDWFLQHMGLLESLMNYRSLIELAAMFGSLAWAIRNNWKQSPPSGGNVAGTFGFKVDWWKRVERVDPPAEPPAAPPRRRIGYRNDN